MEQLFSLCYKNVHQVKFPEVSYIIVCLTLVLLESQEALEKLYLFTGFYLLEHVHAYWFLKAREKFEKKFFYIWFFFFFLIFTFHLLKNLIKLRREFGKTIRLLFYFPFLFYFCFYLIFIPIFHRALSLTISKCIPIPK